MTTQKLLRLAILYSGPSSATGRALLDEFKRRPQFKRVLKKRTDRPYKADVVLRWGTSEHFSRLSRQIELNAPEAVANTTDKFRMLQVLQAAGVPVPDFSAEPREEFKDANGMFYVRARGGKVRYTDTMSRRDAYCTRPINNKRREYRVHVFNGVVWALYEKVPLVEGERPALFNQQSCTFKSRDPEISNCSAEGLEIAKNAVAALGLLFGAVDLVRLKNGSGYVVCEVNTSAGLNGPNVSRFVDLCVAYVNTNLTRRHR